ncbi:NDR1/HIN1-like protein 10 isoform X1 [Argentina anserina]|uniref:NDR1/HIN1-like protein 10 isoform X1 n=1 Tax=Argentina anserina TaxID=57926 RepID=UPI0021768112|nr:NDR1/HIN1-like protein 10 isoform X1 [Potentilla anserina]
MLPLAPPPASPIPPSPLLQAQKQNKPLSLNQIIISKYARNQDALVPAAASHESRKSEKQPMLWPPQSQRTNPLVWCCAIVCLIFSLILIFFGIATLIIFLVVRPRIPLFDIPNAKLSTIYFDSPEYFNGNFAFLANFSNPNRKIDTRFEYLQMELYFSDRLIATQSLDHFTLRPQEGRLEAVELVSSLVYLPQNHALALRTQVQNNRVDYNIRGTFKVRASLGMIHFSYWLHSRCQLQMTGPPTGALVGQSCRTKR